MPISIDLSDHVALVTGGGRGIGKAITRSLVEAGAKVAIASRKLENLEATADEFADLGPTIHPIQCHVGRREDLERTVNETRDRLGAISILVNNSATNIGQGPSLDTTGDMLDKMVEVNVKSAHQLVNLTVPGMIERGGGHVLNIVSISGIQPQPGGLLYSFTKAGLIMMTRSWARELGPKGVRVNAIAPGLIKTDFSTYFWADEKRKQALVGAQPIPRLGLPEDIGPAAAFLSSDLAGFLTGQVLTIDGGATA